MAAFLLLWYNAALMKTTEKTTRPDHFLRRYSTASQSSLALGLASSLALGGAGSGCAGALSAVRGSTGSVTTQQLLDRNKAVDALVTDALKPCATPGKGKPEDSGLVLVTAKPDGSLTVSGIQWQGSDEMKQCILAETPKSHLPAWKGPQVTWIWALGTKDHPPPKPLESLPKSYQEKVTEYTRQAQGNAGLGNDASSGPLAACARDTLPPDSYALVGLKLFLFPDGKVAGVTAISAEADGKDSAFLDCVSGIPKDWTFEAFQGPAFTTLDVPLKHGVNPTER